MSRRKKTPKPPTWFPGKGFTLKEIFWLKAAEFAPPKLPWDGLKTVFIMTRNFTKFKRSVITYNDGSKVVARTYRDTGSSVLQYWVKTK